MRTLILITTLLMALMNGSCQTTDNVTPLDEPTVNKLLYLYEEEKLARDAYDHFEDLYGLTPYVHISESEQTHFGLMEDLLLNLGLITGDETLTQDPGVFTIPEVNSLFTELSTRGEESVIESLLTGAFIEEHDIIDIDVLLAEVNDPQIESTLNLLVEGSKNHLRAFNRNLANSGVVYEPVLLDVSYFNEIIGAERTTGCCTGGKKMGNNKAAGCCMKK